jgi:Group 4 capsule polysaccharide lipoprotein gfcB, YjbF
MGEVLGMRQPIWKWALGSALVLMGCASGNEAPPLQVEVYRSVQKSNAARRSAKQLTPQGMSRAEINAHSHLTITEVLIEDRNVIGYVTLEETRRDNYPGRIEIWRTSDDISMTLRNGMLIATRGFGGDILSSTVQTAQSRPGPAQGDLMHQVRALDDREVTLAFGCDVVDLGIETIEVLEYKYSTRHVQQHCVASSGQVINDYWIDTNGSMIWQSRQWAGPIIGYLRFRRLTE